MRKRQREEKEKKSHGKVGLETARAFQINHAGKVHSLIWWSPCQLWLPSPKDDAHLFCKKTNALFSGGPYKLHQHIDEMDLIWSVATDFWIWGKKTSRFRQKLNKEILFSQVLVDMCCFGSFYFISFIFTLPKSSHSNVFVTILSYNRPAPVLSSVFSLPLSGCLSRTLLFDISKIRNILCHSDAEKLVYACITSRLDYSNSLLSGCPKSSQNSLQLIQNSDWD